MIGLMVMISFSAPAEAADLDETAAEQEKNYAIAPLVISNPNIGSGGGVTARYFY